MADKEYRTIPLTQGQVAIVDAEDYEYLSQFKWQAHFDPKTQTFYAIRNVLMARDVMQAPSGVIVDHRDHNTLDNRRSNLRTATRSQNMINRRKFSSNTSGETGVYFHSRDKKWAAFINLNGKRKYLGYNFPSREDAVAARRRAVKDLHGDFAYKSSAE